MGAQIHQAATRGFHNAAAYDKHRPSYPGEAVQKLLEKLDLTGKQGARIVDLAAGTGKLTTLLAERPEEFEILAIEPHNEMRAALEAKDLKGVVSRSGTAEETGLEGEWADAVICAQSFHWFANEDAAREIHRVLKPDGKLAMIWNIEHYNKPYVWVAATDWEAQLNKLIIDAKTDGQPRFRDYVWKDVFTNPTVQQLFRTPIGEDHSIRWDLHLKPQRLRDRVNTLSHIALLEGEEAEKFWGRFDEIIGGHDVEHNSESEVVMHAVSPFAWTTKL